MATEVNQNYFAWPQEESSVQDSSQGTPQVFDHGSISFGRFELESLAWEKWSVFTNDRRHEEFVKFNGLVAKKKAYFEEYFKRIRELKALQQENQQTELNLEYSGDGSDSSQTGEDEPAAEHGSPAGSGTLINDSMEHTAAETTPEHELECYKDHEYESLNNEISASTRSSPVRGLQLIGQEISENASGDNCSDRMDMLQQNANSSQDDLRMPHETTMTPKRTIKKNSRISQASKIIPKTVKMTSSNIPDNTSVNKGPDSGKSSVINLKAKPENIQSLRRAKAVISVVGITGRSKLMAKEAPGVIAVKRPSSSSAASQRPSTRERRPVTRDGPRKPAEIATPCRPCTAESCPATGGLAPKQGNIATPHRPSTADRRPITKESAPKHANIATPRRPSTAERRPITRDVAPKHAGIATPCRPSTAERRPVTTGTAHKHADVVTLRWSSTAERRPITKESAPKHANIATPRRPSTAERRPITRDVAPKHAGIATPCRPSTAERRPVTTGTAQKRADAVTLRGSSTAERRPITRETAQKHCDVVTLCRPSTAERRPVAREIAPKHANVAPPHRPSIAERRVVTRETALKHANVASPCWPSTPERRLSRESAPKHADIATTPRHPSTGQRHPIDIETTLQSDPITPFRLRAMPAHPKGAMATAVTPKKAITPNLVKSSSPGIESYAKERMEHQVDGIQKSSSVNLPTRKMLTSNVRANRVLENIRKPNKEGIQETVQCRASASKNVTPLQTGRRAPNPPPPPPLPHRPSQIASKSNPNNLSVGGRKPKASAPHWH